jgi:sensor histidine kinase YesM
MKKPRDSSLYWSCQAIGWSLYAIGVALPYVSKLPLGGTLVYSTSLALLGLAQTHALRGYARKRGWERVDIRRIVPRVLVSSTVMGVVMNLFMVLSDIYYLKLLTWAQVGLKWPFLLFSWLWWYFPAFVGWQAVYFAVQFVRRARKAEVEKWQLKLEAQAAELRFLKAQLNPHFLFNALNSLRGLIAEDPSRAQTMVTQLSGFLRHSLSGTTSTVTLSRELEVVNDYLALESIRLEERLRVTIDVEPATLSAPVPAMLVQGLVENGIKHGVALLPEGGELSIRAHVIEAALEVTVTNTAAPEHPKSSDGGVGLANARERLRLLFGEGATLQLDDNLGGRTTARVLIPRVT